MVEFKLADIGEGMHEGEITRWLVKEGERVERDQPIVEVQTDKVNAELTSPVTGTIRKILFAEGETVEVGSTLFIVEPEAEGAATLAPESAREGLADGKQAAGRADAAGATAGSAAAGQMVAPAAVGTALGTAAATPVAGQVAAGRAAAGQEAVHPRPATAVQKEKRVLATPHVRRLAREMKIDIEQVPGTGPVGRVTEEDLRRFVQALQSGVHSGREAEVVHAVHTGEADGGSGRGAAASGEASRKQARHADDAMQPAGTDGRMAEELEERIPLRGVRKKIAEHMVKSVSIIPHVTHVDEVEMDALIALRDRLKGYAEERQIKLTFLPFFIKAIVIALKEFQTLNASIDDQTGEIVLKRYYHIGIATDTEDGLIVPVIKHADRKTIFQLAEEISQLATLARQGKLKLEQITGGTFTISNVGPIGGLYATPIINHPEVAILGLHKMEPRMVVRDWQGVIRTMMHMSLSFDHRLIDGATAVRFTNRIKELLENPDRLFLEMA